MSMIELLTWLDSIGFEVFRFHVSLLWQSSIVMLTAFVVLFFLRQRRAFVRHLILVFAVFAVPVIPFLALIISSLGTPQIHIHALPRYSEKQVKSYSQVNQPEKLNPIDTSTNSTLSNNTDNVVFEPPDTHKNSNEIIPRQIIPKNTLENKKVISFTSYPYAIAVIFYCIGVSIFLVIMIFGRLRIKWWLMKSSVVINNRVVGIFRISSNLIGLKRDFVIVENTFIDTPMTIGSIHPVIVMPTGFANNLSDHDLKAVALHELSHVKRYDPFTLTLVSIIRAFLFFNLFLWIASRMISLLAEQSCDDAVLNSIGEPLSYARMLTKIAEYLPKWTVETELAAGILFSKGSFLRRIETILSDKRDHIRRLSRWAMIGITSAMFISLIMALILPLGETRETGNMVTLSGKVVYKGEPVPDTDIYLNNIILRNVEKVCKTDRKGSFTFEVDSSKLGGRNNYEYYFITPSVIAHNKKYSLGWANLVKGTAYNNLIIHLHEQKKAGGIVTDSSGKPLEGAEIIPYEVYNGNHGVRFSYDHPLITKTDKTGKFHLHNIPNGGYGRFFVRKEGYAQKQIKQLTEFINNRPITLEPEVLIKGRIIFEDTGSPAKNVRVRAVQTITPMWTFETVTNKNGYYTLTNLPSGKFNVYPVFNEAFPEWTAVTNDNVYVKSGEVVENINIKLIKGGVITGRVIAKDTGKPIPNHWIGYNDHSRAENFDSLISMYYTETDADGTFNIRSSPGAGRIITSAPDEYKQEYDERNINKNWVTRSINAVEGETVEAEDIQFERGITVYGTIRMLNGEPVAGVPITNKGRQLAYQSDSEEDGSFIVTGLREGVELSLKAFHPKLMLLGDITFEVQADTTVSILLEKYETTSISGRVIDSEENPMSKAYVMLFINDKLKKTISPWNMISSTLTDDKGAYTFDGLIVGEQYGLDVRVHEYVNLQSFGTLIAKRNMPGHDDIILSKGNRWLEGTVTNTDGIPIEDATVQIRITGSYKYARTDVNGQYRYDNLIKVCTDLALVTHKEYGLFQFRYIPTNSRKNFVLTKGMHYLSGKIVNTEGNPLAGAFLSLEPEIHNSGKYSLRSKTDKNGKFTLENLIEKNVTILVGHEDIGFKTFKNIETDRENVTFELVSDEAAEKASEPGFQFSEKGVVILEDKPAPKLDIERWINGKDIKLADLKGNIIVLYFLSLDIGKCRDIYRFIRILEGEYNDDGVVFIGIHEYTAEIDPLKKLINEKVNTFNIAVDKKSNKKDSKGVTFQNYGISMIPMSFVIDSEGNVHTDIPGVNLENKIKEYIKARKG